MDSANFLITPILKNICERLFLSVIKDSSEEYLETFQTSVMELFEKIVHCVKNVRIWSYSGPYFPTFGLNTGDTEYLSVSSPNTGKCGPE